MAQCPPLDLNSPYAYYLTTSHLAGTSAVAFDGDAMVGFMSAYRPPSHPDTLFVWQIAVDERIRGQGVAGRLLTDILRRPACTGVRYIESTVGPSNTASMTFFKRFAERQGLALQDGEFLPASAFGDAGDHEAEILLRLGPLPGADTLSPSPNLNP